MGLLNNDFAYNLTFLTKTFATNSLKCSFVLVYSLALIMLVTTPNVSENIDKMNSLTQVWLIVCDDVVKFLN